MNELLNNLPSAASLFAGILFGSIGFGAFIYGKKMGLLKPMLIGVALMVYPYFFARTVLVYVIGIALTAALFVFRD